LFRLPVKHAIARRSGAGIRIAFRFSMAWLRRVLFPDLYEKETPWTTMT
jgi:hypothetical protein